MKEEPPSRLVFNYLLMILSHLPLTLPPQPHHVCEKDTLNHKHLSHISSNKTTDPNHIREVVAPGKIPVECVDMESYRLFALSGRGSNLRAVSND